MTLRAALLTTPARSGVFQTATDRRVEQFTASIQFDHRLYAHDIQASIAHAEMLAHVGLLTPEECDRLVATLHEIRSAIERHLAGDPQSGFSFRPEWEDIHMHIEQALIERLGDVGRKLHTARSRNDQVSTALRLWMRDAIDRVDERLANLQRAFIGRCDNDRDVIVPGYTHLQRAQPVLVAHYWLAYCEKFQRDRDRLADCRRRVNQCPLGAGALAGTSLPIDRHLTSQKLGFDGLVVNSLDASSDRDFVLEAASALTLVAEHLSGWAEEWILWSTTEFDMLRLPDAFCTGSSIMPQKINPDVLELIRGKTGRVVGNLQALLTVVKGLPMAYNRDLQEDKEAIFDSFDTIENCLALAAIIVEQAELRRPAIAARLDQGYLDATSLMEYLILRGVPQRTAHHDCGELVRMAMDRNVRLLDLTLEEFHKVNPAIGEDVYRYLGAERVVASYRSYGSSAPEQVEQQVAAWKERLALVDKTG